MQARRNTDQAEREQKYKTKIIRVKKEKKNQVGKEPIWLADLNLSCLGGEGKRSGEETQEGHGDADDHYFPVHEQLPPTKTPAFSLDLLCAALGERWNGSIERKSGFFSSPPLAAARLHAGVGGGWPTSDRQGKQSERNDAFSLSLPLIKTCVFSANNAFDKSVSSGLRFN